jgi:hypothetical protein
MKPEIAIIYDTATGMIYRMARAVDAAIQSNKGWAAVKLVNEVMSSFAPAALAHGGQESTTLSQTSSSWAIRTGRRTRLQGRRVAQGAAQFVVGRGAQQ